MPCSKPGRMGPMEDHGENDKGREWTPLLEEGRRRKSIEEEKHRKQKQKVIQIFKMTALSTLLCVALFILYSAASPARIAPLHRRDLTLQVVHNQEDDLQTALPVDFPDPSIVQDNDGTWYAFATNSGGKNVQVAKASSGRDPLGQWTRLNTDAMPDRSWTSGRNTWAPDVKRLPDGSYIMYFSGELPDTHQHCIGVARSRKITGPYKPDAQPWACPRKQGGAIDASGFLDEGTGRRYVVYKVDGNSMPGFTPCGTGVADPKLRTPLVLQEVDFLDGATKRGNPVEILNRVASEDGPLIEAPELTRRPDGTYVLFFSSHCFQDPKYNIKYAWSTSIQGPYQRAAEPLLQTGDFGLSAPGGPTTAKIRGLLGSKDIMGFHGNCPGGRCFYTVQWGEA